MSKLDELIKELCPNGVAYKELGSISNISKGVQFNKTDMSDEGTYPVINGGINPSGYSERYNCSEDTITISQGGASAGYVNFITTKFWVGAHCYTIKPQQEVLNRYLYHVIKSKEYKLKECQHGAGIPALAKNKVESLKIPVPPLEVQREIVRILDSFTLLTAELTAELTARKKQYEFYRDELLKFDNSIPMVTLGDVATVTKLAGFEFTKYVNYSDEGKIIALRGLNVKNGKLDLTDVKYIDNSDLSKLSRSKLHIGDMLFTYVGTIGQVALIDKEDKYYLAPNVALIRSTTDKLITEYMRYYFQSGKFWHTQINRLIQSSSMKNIPMEKIRKFKLPLPPIEVQKRLVKVLDNFDAICSDLNIGLPAEIKARQKQYEYYRDKLLNFKKLEK